MVPHASSMAFWGVRQPFDFRTNQIRTCSKSAVDLGNSTVKGLIMGVHQSNMELSRMCWLP